MSSPNEVFAKLMDREGKIIQANYGNGKKKIVKSFFQESALYIEEEFYVAGKLKSTKYFVKNVLNDTYKSKVSNGNIKSEGLC